jgi:putative endonuclease
MTQKFKQWFVYVVECSDGSLYTGITTNLKRRISEHNSSKKGAKYTKSRQPVELIYFETASNRSEATMREINIKKLSKKNKIQLIISNTYKIS